MGKEARTVRKTLVGRLAVYFAGTILLSLLVVALAVFAYPKRIAANTVVDGLDLSLAPLPAAKARLESWWEEKSNARLEVFGPSKEAGAEHATGKELGIQLDVDATLAQLPKDGLVAWASRSVGRTNEGGSTYRAVFDFDDLDTARLEQIVAKRSPKLSPAKVVLDDAGKIVRTPEASTMSLVLDDTIASLRGALVDGKPAHVVGEFGAKRVPDDELEKITEVVSTFSTKFSASDKFRSTNLKIAAHKLDGFVLLPGEKFSFNDFVGERSPENGFYKAGVYRRGRHEIDYGGGVCQVSTTLFNAVALANLKVEVRNNHTFLVPYVPAGRDAAVAYGTYDFVFVNTMDTPIAVSTKWIPGKLTFTVLGQKVPDQEVVLQPSVTASWEHPVEYVDDPTLKPGEEKEIEKGGKGYRATTLRIVKVAGKEVSRETLCKSYYKGGPKIIARGPLPVPPPLISDGL